MLERLVHLTEQNHRILKGMHRAAMWGRFMHFLYWVFIIGISIVTYYYIKPYLGSLQTALGVIDQIKDLR